MNLVSWKSKDDERINDDETKDDERINKDDKTQKYLKTIRNQIYCTANF